MNVVRGSLTLNSMSRRSLRRRRINNSTLFQFPSSLSSMLGAPRLLLLFPSSISHLPPSRSSLLLTAIFHLLSASSRLRADTPCLFLNFFFSFSAFQFSAFPRPPYFSAEKLVGSMKYRSIWSTSAPFTSESFFTFCHSGSAWKAAQFFSASWRLGCSRM